MYSSVSILSDTPSYYHVSPSATWLWFKRVKQTSVHLSVSPVLDQSAEEAAGGRQVEGGAYAAQRVWPWLERDDLDVQEVGQLDERHLTCQTTKRQNYSYYSKNHKITSGLAVLFSQSVTCVDAVLTNMWIKRWWNQTEDEPDDETVWLPPCGRWLSRGCCGCWFSHRVNGRRGKLLLCASVWPSSFTKNIMFKETNTGVTLYIYCY